VEEGYDCSDIILMKSGYAYQVEASEFFQSLGLITKVEADIVGVRGQHRVDVWVTGKIHAFSVQWLIECKDWKSNVPKEKVLALQAIVQDIGADRGFLLSEKGFQAGAVRCATNTNITLTSLQDLRDSTKSYISGAALAEMSRRIAILRTEFRRFRDDVLVKGYGDVNWPANNDFIYAQACIGLLEWAVADAVRGKFPTLIGYKENTDTPCGIYAASAEDLILNGMPDILKAELVLEGAHQNGANPKNKIWPFDIWNTPYDAKVRWAKIPISRSAAVSETVSESGNKL
jgi:hypothetical protein